MKSTLLRLTKGEILSEIEAFDILTGITEERYNEPQITAFLTVYMMRQITAQELNGFRKALIEKSIKLNLGTKDALDLCGTGGDGKDTFNISTLASLVAAGSGYTVIKHGNYSASSACGSSNVLEACGYKLTNNEEILKQQLVDGNFCYLHAPLFHPSLKSVAPIRRSLGVKTFFNILGPLVNPVQPAYQIVGVYNREIGQLYSDVLKTCRSGYRVVHSLDGYDEISLTSDFLEFYNGKESVVSPREYNLSLVQPNDLWGGNSVDEAAEIFMNILEGRGTESQNNVVLVNAAAAIRTMSAGLSSVEAMAGARASLFNGEALRSLKAASEVC